jgi:hypothetical protein
MRACIAVLGISVPLSGAGAGVITFVEDFDDGLASNRWSAPIVDAELGLFDGSVDYAFDYGAVGIPAAPNSGGSTTGLFFEANLNDDGAFDEGELVGINSSIATIPGGDFRLTMDAWFEVDFALAASTEYANVGVFASGPNAPGDPSLTGDSAMRFGLSDGDGLTFSLSSDGGSASDILVYSDPGNANSGGQVADFDLDDIPNGSIPGVGTGIGEDGPAGAGWVELAIESVAGMISFQINGFELATFDNTGGAHTGGTIQLGYSDVFNSSTGAGLTNFIVYDNVVLEIPTPSSAALLLIAGAGAARRRR